ncbi:MAG: hypothetical protein EON47_09190 [Acetobacteraceae bacterium]|nr:MAG: hypothetical protein EON47_09190 [Acetobacteraceae bacterium]
MADCHHDQDEAAAPGRPVLSLEAEALFVIGVSRAWTAALRPDPAARDETPDWRQIFALASLPAEAATAYGSFMTLVMQSRRRPLDIRGCSCPQVGRDEEALLRIIGALQAGDLLAALDELDDWVLPGNRTPALRAAGAVAALFGTYDIAVPHQAAAPQPVPGRLLQ